MLGWFLSRSTMAWIKFSRQRAKVVGGTVRYGMGTKQKKEAVLGEGVGVRARVGIRVQHKKVSGGNQPSVHLSIVICTLGCG